MTKFKLNTCDLCLGLSVDLSYECEKKDQCPYHLNPETQDEALNNFARFLEFQATNLKEALENKTIRPGEEITVCCSIEKEEH